jgi:hypothetical protein
MFILNRTVDPANSSFGCSSGSEARVSGYTTNREYVSLVVARVLIRAVYAWHVTTVTGGSTL